MGRFVVSGAWLVLAWIATAIMACATLGWLVSIFVVRQA
jgi:type III secretory pathway component EscS